MHIALQYIQITTFSISTKSLVQVTSYNRPFSKIRVPKIHVTLKNLVVKYCWQFALVVASPLPLMELCRLQFLWRKVFSDGSGSGKNPATEGERQAIQGLGMETLWRCCHLASIALGEISEIRGPFFQRPCRKPFFGVAFWRFFTKCFLAGLHSSATGFDWFNLSPNPSKILAFCFFNLGYLTPLLG